MQSARGEIGSVIDSIASDDGRRAFAVIDDATYEFARLGWAARNRVTHAAVAVDGGAVELAPLAFATALTRESLIARTRNGAREVITEGWLDRAPAHLGDRLMAVAVHVNRRRPLAVDECPGEDGAVIAVTGGVRYSITPLRWGDRNRLIEHASGGDRSYDPAVFNAGLLRRVVAEADGGLPDDEWLERIDADVGDALLAIALRVSCLSRADTEDIARAIRAQRPHTAMTLFTLCKEFGWTPAQIRGQLAADIDALLAVHRAIEIGSSVSSATPATPATPAAPATPIAPVARSPVAGGRGHETVILVVDDEGGDD